MTPQQKDHALQLASKLSYAAAAVVGCRDVEILSLRISTLNEARANYEEFIINAKREEK